MRRFIQWISKNGIILAILMILILIGSSVILMFINSNLAQKNQEFESDVTVIKEEFESMLNNIQTADLAMRGYSIAQTDQMLIPMTSAQEGHRSVFSTLKVLFNKYNLDVEGLQKLETKFKDYIELDQQMIEEISNGNMDKVAEVLKSDPGYLVWKDYVDFKEPIIANLDTELVANNAEYEAIFRNSVVLQIIIFLFGLPSILLMVRRIKKNEKSLDKLFGEIEKSNRAFIFDNQDDTDQDQKRIIDHLIENLKKASNYINHISEGNYEVEWEGMTKELREHNQKNLAGELIKMKYRMIEVKQQDELRMWHTEGLAKFAEIVRTEVNNLEEMSDKIIGNLVNYVKANQGGLFLVNDENRDNIYIELKGCYAYERKKYVEKKIEPGQGLIGQTYKEGTTLLLKEIPENYVNITSGLGESTPGYLVIVPLTVNEKIVGLVELASFEEIKPHQIDFLEKVGEIIASSINGIRTNDKTKEILALSQSQQEEMRAQEEEMRQNMEEMEATQEEMGRTQRELAEKENNLKALIDNTTDLIITLNRDFEVLVVNKVGKQIFKELHNVDLEEGANILNLVGAEKDYWQDILDKTLQKESQQFKRELLFGNHTIWREYYVSPIKDQEANVVGISIISRDITESIEAQKDLAFERSLFTALMENSPDAIYFKDRESKFLRISNALLKTFKAKNQKEILGKSDFDFFEKEHAQPAFDGEQEIIKTGKAIVDLLEKEVHTDGSITWVETNKMPLHNEDGELIGTFGVSKNVTERMNAQSDLETSRLISEGMINQSSNSYLVVDQNYNVLLINDALKHELKNTGINVKLNESFLSGLDKTKKAFWKARFEEIIKKGQIEDVIDQGVEGDKERNIRGRLIKNELGEIVGIGIILNALGAGSEKTVKV